MPRPTTVSPGLCSLPSRARRRVAAVLAAMATLGPGVASARFREPAVEHGPYHPIDVRKPGLHLQLNFPPAANAGAERRTYWLTGDEPVIIDVQVAAGAGEALSAPEELTGVVLLDGQQVPVQVDGGAAAPVWRRRLERAGTIDRFAIELAGRQIAAGAHRLSLLLWRGGGRPFPSVGFAVMKDGTKGRESRESPGFARAASDGRPALTVVRRDRATPLMGSATAVGDEPLPLSLIVDRAANDGLGPALGLSFVAFLDGRQIPLGALGPRPHLRLGGGERATAHFELAPRTLRPRRNGAATLVVFALLDNGPPSSTSPPLQPKAIAWSEVVTASERPPSRPR